MKVRVLIDLHDPRAPGAITAELLNKRLERCLLRAIRANGFPKRETKGFVEGGSEELAGILSDAQLRQLRRRSSGVFLLDPFEAGNLWGYDGNEALSKCAREDR